MKIGWEVLVETGQQIFLAIGAHRWVTAEPWMPEKGAEGGLRRLP